MINVNAFVIYNLWLSIIYVHPLTSYVHVCDVDVVDVEREFLLSPKNKREPQILLEMSFKSFYYNK